MTKGEAAPSSAPRLLSIALRQPALLLTAAYLLTAVIGMVVAWFKYRAFGVAIFDWWEPSDYFLAAFREPWAFLVAALAAGYAWLVESQGRSQRARNAARRAAGDQDPSKKRWWNRTLTARYLEGWQERSDAWMERYGGRFAAGAGVFLFFGLADSVPRMLDHVLDREPQQVVVHLADGSRLPDPQMKSDRCVVLGTSNAYVFVGLGPTAQRVVVLPQNAVSSIELLQP